MIQDDSLLGIDRCIRSYRVAVRGDRGPLFPSHVLHRVLRAFLQEESSHPRRDHCIRYLHHDGRGSIALPHEQREIPSRARFRQGGFLRKDEPVSRDMLARVGRRARSCDDTLSPFPETFHHLQNNF